MPAAPLAPARPSAVRQLVQGELNFDRTAADAALLRQMPERMRTEQVCRVLGCEREHVHALREGGAITGIDIRAPKAGKACWRYYRESLRAYLAARPTRADADAA